MSFPTRRFETAGLSAEEIEPLQAQFDNASPQLQQAMADRWAGLADADLGELAKILGALAPQDEPDPEPEPGADEPEPEPALTPSPTVAADRARDGGESDDPPDAAA